MRVTEPHIQKYTCISKISSKGFQRAAEMTMDSSRTCQAKVNDGHAEKKAGSPGVNVSASFSFPFLIGFQENLSHHLDV
jgi:hypothetical protein